MRTCMLVVTYKVMKYNTCMCLRPSLTRSYGICNSSDITDIVVPIMIVLIEVCC